MTDIVERLRKAAKNETETLRKAVHGDTSAVRVISDQAADEIERLREALNECADSLEAYVEHEYVNTKDHPAMAWRYERDMEDVYRARALLKKEGKDD
jgi:hypothetical protein